MIKKLSLLVIGILIFVVVSVIYNYQVAQKAIKDTKPSVLNTELVSYPETILVGKTGTFFWHVDTPNDLHATDTTIYYDPISSPSALTVTDSPDSVGYRHRTHDYNVGKFKLPDTFDSQIIFDQPGKIFFRSYAKVGNLHLWSKEYVLTVLSNQ